MSDRGSILISTANDIGEALVEKLGGEGYAPSVWDKEYNKLGIAEVDSAPALSVLEDSSETGTARGSILLSTANAIGAMLNKKYNTDRGFKPKEWASAGRKMKALETDTKSGSIVNIQGAKETPLLSLVGTIDPTIEGTSEVNAYKLGKNLLNASASSYTFNVGDNYRFNCGTLSLKKGVTYTFSANQQDALTSNTRNTLCIGVNEVYTYENASATNYHNQSGSHSMQYTPNEDCEAVFLVWVHTPSNAVTYSNFMVEVGSSASTYEPYKTPTTYTADLGETVHGGKVDFIKGEVKDAITETKTFTGAVSEVWQYSSAYGWFYIDNQFSDAYRNNQEKDFMACNLGTQQAYANVTVLPNMTFACTSGTNSRFVFKNTDYDNVDDFKAWLSSNNMVVAYRKADFVPFSITPIEINTSGDVENYYTSAGDTSIEYYAVPTPYARGTASGAIANVQSARTDLPFTMVKANIAPNLTGVESVEVNKIGKNLIDGSNFTRGLPNTNIGASIDDITSSYRYEYYGVVAGGVLTVSSVTTDDDYFNLVLIYGYSKGVLKYYSNTQAGTTKTVDFSDCDYVRIGAGARSGYIVPTDLSDYGTIQLEVNDTATAYTPYEEPTVYTADLGEPVYGGSVDLVSGEIVKGYARVDMGSLSWIYQGEYSRFYTASLINVIEKGSSGWKTDIVSDLYTTTDAVNPATPDKSISEYASTGYIYVKDLDYSDKDLFTEHVRGHYLTYPLATPIESSIPGQVIVPSEGVNNLWNNAGGDTDVEYFEQE